MTFLQLVNKVLVRLRENEIGTAALNSNPFYRSISAHVNDAKSLVEESWQWSALRGTDTVNVTNTTFADLPNSDDSSYILKGMFSSTEYDPLTDLQPALTPMRPLTQYGVRQRYMGGDLAVPTGQPREYGIIGRSPTTGNMRVKLNPKVQSGTTFTLTMDRVAKQPELVAAADRLLVPSLPVFAYAVALASRERGEVGGLSTSELLVLADNYLSDAIAFDSANYGMELDWYPAGDTPSQTNLSNR